MDEQTRRTEILQAEEAIRQLAGELARASAAADGAQSAGQRFDRAVAMLSDARERIAAAAEQAEAASQSTRFATEQVLSEARAGRESIEQARGTLLEASAKMSASLREALEQSRRRFDESAAGLAQLKEELAQAGRAADVGESSRAAFRAALETIRSKLDEAGEKVFASIGGLDDVRQRFSRIGDEMVDKPNRLIQNVDARLAELSRSLSGMSMAINDLRNQASQTSDGGRADGWLATTLARQSRMLLIVTVLAAGGMAVGLVVLVLFLLSSRVF